MTTSIEDDLKSTTYFAPARIASEKELKDDVEFIAGNELVTQLLKSANGLLAVLNKYRQTIVVNEVLLKLIGIDKADDVFGLRPGEALACRFAELAPSGCGTGETCASCGAAIAIVSALEKNRPKEMDCVLSSRKNGKETDYFFNIKASPFEFTGKKYILLFINDITKQREREKLERVFFHDINNVVAGILSGASLLETYGEKKNDELAVMIKDKTARLAREIDAQRILLSGDDSQISLMKDFFSVAELCEDLARFAETIPAAKNKKFFYSSVMNDFFIKTDYFLLLRILTNMILNAFENSPQGEYVKLYLETTKNSIRFLVENKAFIPPRYRQRIFQKNFTTKTDPGRGLGTYSMKLLGEKHLGGKVGFETSEDSGTTFFLELPLDR